MKYKHSLKCNCGCEILFETDDIPPHSVKCFKCKSKVSRKDADQSPPEEEIFMEESNE